MEIRTLTPKELDSRLKGNKDVFVLDVRSEDKFNEYHLKHSMNIPKTTIFEMEDAENVKDITLPKDKEIIIACTTGNSAAKCANILAKKNFNVTVLEGGLTAWKEYSKSK
ncbi:rhodanese-like domain-containing protein [Heyndrickxia sporothermodurans]|uniref:Uncharacterized protein n=1 Tax=Heyndrickxia sporothermodurans TaxID=46224 RepID=A0A150LA27_9BACI|nr:rhodanese-like domain-containing protein [Heyndrickxia sporothermodurans]KYD09100.1 hypothetical protein B4102_2627 [Heyndrickxia sporothermodurans]MEB6548662.1 rhodanese-like domain-containing protein [Heyndrickxia sporothermodurans]PTY80505.1 hypothetical protein B5V89_01620 [Heyndrickxia sporothermodurans]